MKHVFIINGHQEYPFSSGKLNASLVRKAEGILGENGYEVKVTATAEPYKVEEEIEKFKWADIVILQMPINWMSGSWSCKKYIDDVWTVGMMGELSDGDGRYSAAPKKNYGMGGRLKGKYMLSVTANAPKEAFNNPDEHFFEGISEDDLLLHIHLNFKWLGLEPLPTFMAYDVMKNPEVENDFKRFEEHLNRCFPKGNAKIVL